MVNLLAHCLSAMALQSVINPTLGMNFLSESSFIAGIVSMIVHLDRDCYNGKRTPILHSALFGVLWSLVALAVVSALFALRSPPEILSLPLLAVVPTGIFSHLLSDVLTEEGIYLFPLVPRVSEWFLRRPDPENSWVSWRRISLSRRRKNDDPMLNLCVSLVSLAVLLSLLALTPL